MSLKGKGDGRKEMMIINEPSTLVLKTMALAISASNVTQLFETASSMSIRIGMPDLSKKFPNRWEHSFMSLLDTVSPITR